MAAMSQGIMISSKLVQYHGCRAHNKATSQDISSYDITELAPNFLSTPMGWVDVTSFFIIQINGTQSYYFSKLYRRSWNPERIDGLIQDCSISTAANAVEIL